ncbi:hypothetical protein [Bradyrhizobium sp. Ash2021]|uniref:hypothetical protein n=1 Tax=Bradyrhizobium sp. Ash2021 TaxID=2954771 RepID=UPI002815CA66|nr:hypothetical protein [Bradyrhizobium sp. Ash2021]WMT77452.1 hypothetical protein NL528_14330 [Bradyrhizobium sp. Ash2021]
MIVSYEVGSIFRVIDEASPALRKILAEVRRLNTALDQARASLAAFGKSPVALTAAISEAGALATAWGDVAKNAGAARLAIGNASRVAARTALPAAAAAATGGRAGAPPPRAGGGGGAHRPGWLGGGAHVYGPGVTMPGGTHIRMGGGRMGGAATGAMAGAGLLGYGVYEAAEMEDAVFQLIYHSGLEQNDVNRAKFRKILQDSMVQSGYGLKDIAKSAKQEIRMFQGTPGGGIDVLPEMLRAATIEARLKDSTPEESMRALIGLAHMTKQYSPEAIKKLAPAFAFLSTANPASLGSIERAASYAVPLLQSGLEIDPMQTLLLGTALTRAGATNTKSGTWLREMAIRAMPGTSLMSKMMYRKHEAALKELGLSDEKGKPTWFTDGKPDLLKMLDIGGTNAPKIPVERRAAIERSLFGAQGGGGFALLADPAVRQQVQSLREMMESPDFKNRYAGFTESYREGSTVQNARTAMQEFNITMMDLGKTVLPAVNVGLHDLKSVLEGIRSVLPSRSTATVGARTGEGALVGALAGSFIPGVGTLGGAAIGGLAGGTLGVAEQYLKNMDHHAVITGNSAAEKAATAIADAIRGMPAGPGGVFAGGTSVAPKATLAPIALTINLDGKPLAEAISTAQASLSEHPLQAPAADGMGQHYGGDHNWPDK